MAQTFAAAFADAAGDDLDVAAGFVKARPEHAPVPSRIAAAWCHFDWREISRLIEQIASIGNSSHHLAEEAVADSLAILYERRQDVFEEDPKAMLGLLNSYARKRLLKLRERQRGGGLVLSLDVLFETEGTEDHPLDTATAAVAYTRAGVDEDARFTPPPGPGEAWERLHAIGAAQRFRDRTGRAPGAKDLTPENGMPSLNVVQRLFGSITELLLESGVPLEHTPKTRNRWTARDSAEECYRFRRREGYWPSESDAKALPAGTLPPTRAMERYFGGTTAIAVQLGSEAILGPIDLKSEGGGSTSNS